MFPVRHYLAVTAVAARTTTAVLTVAVVCVLQTSPLCHAVQLGTELVEPAPQPGTHGDMRRLEEVLFRGSDTARLLDVADQEFRSGRADRIPGTAIELLQQLLVLPHDAFVLNAPGGSVESFRSSALRMLRAASPAFRTQWRISLEVAADQRLQSAIQSGSRGGLSDVAREFPLTDAGMHAVQLLIVDQLQKGFADEARRLAKSAMELYAIDQRFRPVLQELRNVTTATAGSSAGRHSDNSMASGESIVGVSTMGTPVQRVSRPWLKPLWTISESSLGVSSAMGDEWSAFAPEISSMLPARSNRPEFENWRPVIRPDVVICRTPFRIIGFERLTGEVRWQIPTNSFTSARTGSSISRATGDQPATAEFWLPRVHDPAVTASGLFGQLSSDHGMLYFLDRFNRRKQEVRKPFLRGFPNNFGGIRNNLSEPQPETASQQDGSTLVAVRLNSLNGIPEIAWVLGADENFDYQIESSAQKSVATVAAAGTSAAKSQAAGIVAGVSVAGVSVAARSVESVSQSSDGPHSAALRHHRFLSLPVGRGPWLYVLSLKEDQIWANCLDRATGVPIWQQPLAYDAEVAIQRFQLHARIEPSASCVLANDQLICCLPTETMISLQLQDGRLNWATSLQPAELNSSRNLPRVSPDSGEHMEVFWPLADDTTIVGSGRNSRFLTAINVATGRVHWSVLREAVGPGAVLNSVDRYAVRICGDQLILIGDHHCRSVSMKDGTQNWAAEILPSTGRAWCGENRCLIPELGGRIAMVDLNSGAIDRVSPGLCPVDEEHQIGSIVSDDQLVCFATATSLAVFPSADEILRELDTQPEVLRDPLPRSVVRAQAEILNGGRAQALAILTKPPARADTIASGTALADSHSDSASQLSELAGELLLEECSRLLFPEHAASESKAGLKSPELTAGMNVSLNDQLKLASTLKLTRQQEQRLNLYRRIADSRGLLPTATLTEQNPLRLRSSLSGFVEISSAWSVDAQLMWQEEQRRNSAARNLRSEIPGNPPESSDHDFMQLSPVFVERAILFPDQVGDSAAQIRLARHLIHHGQNTAAELFVQACLADLSDASGSTAAAFRTLLPVAEGQSPVDLQSASAESAETVVRARAPKSLVIRPHGQLRSADSLTSAVGNLHAVSTLGTLGAAMSKQQLRTWFQSSEYGLTSHLKSFDLSSGAELDDLQLPFSGTQIAGTDNQSQIPHLIAVAGVNRIAAVSCLRPGAARILWQRDVRTEVPAGDSAVRIGSIGPNYLVWHSGMRLHCSHPLTGADLWIRDCSQSQPLNSLLFQPPPLFGDQSVTIVFDGDGNAYRRFSTRDGRTLSSGRLSGLRMEYAVSSERRLLYFDEAGRVRCFDGSSEVDVLSEQAPLMLLSTENPFRRLSAGRIVMMTQDMEIAVVDISAGKVQFRSPTKDLLRPDAFYGMSSFETGGRLFVCIHHEQGLGEQPVANPRLGEPRIDYGTLFCLDPNSGEILWTRKSEPSVVMPVHGDASDVLIHWSLITDEHDPFRDRSLRSVTRQLQVHAIDMTTGLTIASHDRLGNAYPLRCIYNAALREYQLICQGALVTLTEDQPPE